jgi:hypothetical protein
VQILVPLSKDNPIYPLWVGVTVIDVPVSPVDHNIDPSIIGKSGFTSKVIDVPSQIDIPLGTKRVSGHCAFAVFKLPMVAKKIVRMMPLTKERPGWFCFMVFEIKIPTGKSRFLS